MPATIAEIQKAAPHRRGQDQTISAPYTNETMNYVNKMSNKKSKIEVGGETVPYGLEAQIRATLQSCTAAKLYKILQLKKVPLRSKLRKKTERVDALVPILSPSELEELGLKINNPKPLPDAPIMEEGTGLRKNTPVMGVDVHRDTLVWAIADPSGITQEGSLTNDTGGIQTLIATAKMYRVSIVAMESTAELWVPLCWGLQDEGIETLLANPAQLKETQGKKTDEYDAKRIALAIRDGRLLPSVICNREQFALRKNMRFLTKQVHNLTSIKNRLNQIYKRCDVPDRIKKYRKSKRGLFILKSAVKCTNSNEMFEIIAHAYFKGRGRTFDDKKLTQYTNEMWNFMETLDIIHERARFAILMGNFFECEASILYLEREGLIYAKRHPTFLKNLKHLISIPGVNIRSALSILAEIVDIRYFKEAKSLAKWAGLVPRNKQSGFKKRSTGRLHKRGNKFLRRAVWTVVNSEAGKHPHEGHSIREFVSRLKQLGTKSYKTVITAGAHKLLVLIHHLLWAQEDYLVICGKETQLKIINTQNRKTAKLKNILKKMPVDEVIPAFVNRLENSWGIYQARAKEFEELCASLFDNDILEVFS